MSGLGTPPPDERGDDRRAIAAWYAEQVLGDECVENRDDPATCQIVQDLISGAIDAGVIAEPVTVAWLPRPVPLHTLLGPYRRIPGGEQERSEQQLREVLDNPAPKGQALRRNERREWIR